MNSRGEVMGKTHCDTIGDYFKNKYVFSLVQKWFRKQFQQGDYNFPGDIKVWKNRKNKDLGFTEEYEDFVGMIFGDSGNMEDFLDFMRAECIDDEKKWELYKGAYETEDFIRLLLSFQELYTQLNYDAYGRVSRQTIGGIFSTRISDILRISHSTDVSETDDTCIHRSIEVLFEEGVSPISADGKILCYLGEGENGGYEVKQLGQKKNIVFEVKKNGFDILDREEIFQEKGEHLIDIHGELEKYRKYLEYHNDIDSIELLEIEEEGYFQERFNWEHENQEKSKTEKEIGFRRYLEKNIQDLNMRIRSNAKVVDISGNPIQDGETNNKLQVECIPEGFQLYTVPSSHQIK